MKKYEGNLSITPLGFISTKTYQKMMNLYLYLPSNSAHPPGALKGLIVGNLQRYWRQNTNKSDYINIVKLFILRLVARGYTLDILTPIFNDASNYINNKLDETSYSTTDSQIEDQRETLFFHTEYHPRDLSRRIIRELYNKHLAEYSGFKNFTVCYSRPRNIRDALIKSTLADIEGYRASDVLDEMKSM